jgi:hypothetical protein
MTVQLGLIHTTVSKLAVSSRSTHSKLTITVNIVCLYNAHVHSDGYAHVTGRSSEGGVLAREYSSEE